MSKINISNRRMIILATISIFLIVAIVFGYQIENYSAINIGWSTIIALSLERPTPNGVSFNKEAYNGYKEIYGDKILAEHYATNDLYSLGIFKVESR